MTMNELIMKAREKKCSDIHISEGMPVSFRIHGQLLVLYKRLCLFCIWYILGIFFY